MENERVIKDYDFKVHAIKVREEIIVNRQVKKFRVTSGGDFKDFDDFADAIKYLEKMANIFCYASINCVCPKLFEVCNVN